MKKNRDRKATYIETGKKRNIYIEWLNAINDFNSYLETNVGKIFFTEVCQRYYKKLKSTEEHKKD